MNRDRHAIQSDDKLREYFEYEGDALRRSVQVAGTRLPSLHGLFLTAKNVYLAGSVLAPTSPATATALGVGARALAGLVALEVGGASEYTFSLGEGPRITVARSAGERFLDMILWRKAFELSVVTRQPALVRQVCEQEPAEIVSAAAPSAPPSEANLAFVAYIQELSRGPGFADTPLLRHTEEACRRVADGSSPGADYNRQIWLPFYAAARHLAGGEPAGIESAFSSAVDSHRRYWSSTPNLRKNMEGWVSLPLTALAALAWDRGLRFRVDSDYLPWPWVTGDLFRQAGTEEATV